MLAVHELLRWRAPIHLVRRGLDDSLVDDVWIENLVTSAGKNLLVSALGQPSGSVLPQVTYCAVGKELATLTSQLNSGTAYTSLAVTALPAAVPSGSTITINPGGTSTQTVTTSALANAGALSISVTSFTANATYATTTPIVVNPAVGDTQLYNEQYRQSISSSAAGGTGEYINTTYLQPAAATSFTIQEIGWFAGSATGSANTGTLVGRVLYTLAKTNVESLQIDRHDTLS